MRFSFRDVRMQKKMRNGSSNPIDGLDNLKVIRWRDYGRFEIRDVKEDIEDNKRTANRSICLLSLPPFALFVHDIHDFALGERYLIWIVRRCRI